MLKDRIVLGIRDKPTQTELLKVNNFTLQKCVDICRAAETAHIQGNALKVEAINVNKVSSPAPTERECKFCGNRHRFRKDECPAYGKTCRKCGKPNHFLKKCTKSDSKPLETSATADTPQNTVYKPLETSATADTRQNTVYQVGHTDTSDTLNWCEPEVSQRPGDDSDWVNRLDAGGKDLKCRMLTNDEQGWQTCFFQIDTGSTVNMIRAALTKAFTPTNKTLIMWNGTQQVAKGTTKRLIKNPRTGEVTELEFVIFEENLMPLLGLQASEKMGPINVCRANFEQIAKIGHVEDSYSDVFDTESIGTLPGLQHLEVDSHAQPQVMASRRVPISIRPAIKAELDRMVEKGVIAPVNRPTPWVSQMVASKKKKGVGGGGGGGIRICIDLPHLNKALKREHYTLPVLEDVLHELSQSSVFSKADLSSAFWHVQLDEESSFLTTFQTCFGRYRWLRLPFGLSVSSEIFQKKLLGAFGDLEGVICVADDVIIHGDNNENHDKHLSSFLARCQEKNVRLGKDKFVLRFDTINFMGHTISKSGLQTTDEKVAAITEYPAPTSLEELRRFLGMVNYLSRYLDHLADILHPLQNLLKKDTQWNWSEAQEQVFQRIKIMIATSPVLAFYDPYKKRTLVNDASDYGLGCHLEQDGCPVVFASRTLSDTEQRYSQIEKEMLAVIY